MSTWRYDCIMDDTTKLGSDPNKMKNRLPTMKEERIIRQVIKKEEQKLHELDSEIVDLRVQVKAYQSKMQEMESVLHAARRLCAVIEKTVSSIDELSSCLLQHPDHSAILSAASPTRRIQSIGTDLSKTNAAYLKGAQSALEKARQEYRCVEEEIDVNGSLLHHVNYSLTSRIELRSHLDANLRRMKDLIGPRRRIPNELWLLILWERVMEDEEEYVETWRKGRPPYTTLKLTWVCRLWRQIVTNQPSLWRFIALPETVYLTSVQADRLRYFKERLRGYPPDFYMEPAAKSTMNDISSPKTLLKGFPRIKSFEARVTSDPKVLEWFLDTSQLEVEELYLVAAPRDKRSESSLALTYNAIKNVKSLFCVGVTPHCGTNRSEDRHAELDSLCLSLRSISTDGVLAFLKASGTSTLSVECYADWVIWGFEGEQDISLTRLTTITAPPQALKSMFHQRVLLPNLHTLTVEQDSTRDVIGTTEHCISFLSIHERQNTITTLGISGQPLIDDEEFEGTQVEVASMYGDLINRLSNLGRLILKGKAVVPSLKGLAASRKIPPSIVVVKISESDEVEEEHIIAFLQEFYSKQRNPLSLKIKGCVSITKEIEEHLDVAHGILKLRGIK
ncbi:hypothetical protein CPB86DRAFT_743120 [Serendipita vermifera]|nr:hypothetical protein CPB86DRAFT_743120 [Serendipita vermifera]